MPNQSVERDLGLAAPLRSAAKPKRLTPIVGRENAWLNLSAQCEIILA